MVADVRIARMRGVVADSSISSRSISVRVVSEISVGRFIVVQISICISRRRKSSISKRSRSGSSRDVARREDEVQLSGEGRESRQDVTRVR